MGCRSSCDAEAGVRGGWYVPDVTTDTHVDPLSVVDQDKLVRFLGGVAETGPDLELALLSGGLSNLTYVARTGGREYAVPEKIFR
jgi:hypothetical protein